MQKLRANKIVPSDSCMESWIWSISMCVLEFVFQARELAVSTVSGRCRLCGWQEAKPQGFSTSERWQCHCTLVFNKISRFSNCDVPRKYLKNVNSMCDVTLSMWWLFSLFPPFSMKNKDESRPSKNTKYEKARESKETGQAHRMTLF